MARPKLKAEAYIELSESEAVLWYTIDESGKVTWLLPKNKEEAYKQAMLDRISRNMSVYVTNHPESGLLKKANEL